MIDSMRWNRANGGAIVEWTGTLAPSEETQQEAAPALLAVVPTLAAVGRGALAAAKTPAGRKILKIGAKYALNRAEKSDFAKKHKLKSVIRAGRDMLRGKTNMSPVKRLISKRQNSSGEPAQ